jgi:5-methylcytosine-specific restriction endonuclease McrA
MAFVLNIDSIKPWDDIIAEVFDGEQIAIRIEDREARHAKYEDYLASPEWAAKRELVLQREGYVCQGCGVARATQAHHVTYAHLRHEFLWELLAVCKECHTRYHAEGWD